MNRCKYCGRLLKLTPEYDTCMECQGRIMREATMPFDIEILKDKLMKVGKEE